jgi:general secretion pathway protein B
MSFVLEALRKSEQERQQATAPGLGVLFPAIVEERSTSTTRPLVITALAVTAIAALLWVALRPQDRLSGNSPVPPVLPKATAAAPAIPKAALIAIAPPTSQSSSPSSFQPASQAALPAPEVKNIVPAATVPKAIAKIPEAAAPSVPTSARTAFPDRAKAESAKDATKVTRSAATAPSPEVTQSIASPSSPDAVGAPRELAPAAQKHLPEMTIAGYIHDDQAGSMAMINDKLVREGEEVSPGLRLEKILPDGAIFSYRGERFRR